MSACTRAENRRVFEWILTLNLRCKDEETRVSLGKPCINFSVRNHLWMPFDPSSLLANTSFVRFGIYHFQQVQGIVNTSGREALDLPGFLRSLFRVIGVETVPGREGPRTCGLGALLFITTLVGSSFLRWCTCFLFCKETGGFSLTSQLFLTLGFLVGILILFSTLIPLGCLLTFLWIFVSLDRLASRKTVAHTLSTTTDSFFFASFSAFLARPDSFFAFPPRGGILIRVVWCGKIDFG